MRLLRRLRRRSKRYALPRRPSHRHTRHKIRTWSQRLVWTVTRPLAWLPLLVIVPWRILRYLSALLTGVWNRRHRRHLMQGLPALVGGSAVLLLGIFIHLQADDLVNDYRDAALQAFRRNDFQRAKLYFERLIELGGETPDARYDLAITLSRLGSDARAEAIMHAIAPLEGVGFARAHVWLARKLLVPAESSRAVDQLDTAYAHLMRAKPMLRDAPEIDWMLAQYFAAKGQNEAAVPHLLQAAQKMPELYFELSLLYATLGQLDEARKAAYRADAHYRHQVQANAYDHDARLRWASIRVNLQDFESAVRILTEGLTLQPEGPYQRALAATFVARYDQAIRQQANNKALGVELLRIALKHDPNSREALQRLVAISDDASAAAIDPGVLETLLASGYANAFAHFVLGCRAWEADQADAAVWHLERAYHLDEQLAPVANNLAWILAQEPQPDLQRALKIINSVIQHAPHEGAYRDTRGQIYVKLERWPEALDDLQAALPQLRENRQLHEAMAKVYQALGRAGLAEKHAQIAAYLAKQQR